MLLFVEFDKNVRDMRLKRFFVILFWACAIGNVIPAFGEGDTLRCRFYFPVGSSDMNLYYKNNGASLENLMYDIRCRQEHSVLKRIILRSGASPEGNSFNNKTLSDKRLMALRATICERLFVPDTVFEYRSEGEDWDGLAELIEKSKMPNKNEALSIIRNTPVCIVWGNAVVEARKKQLKALRGGSAWRYMAEHFFAELRSGCMIECVFEKKGEAESRAGSPEYIVPEGL